MRCLWTRDKSPSNDQCLSVTGQCSCDEKRGCCSLSALLHCIVCLQSWDLPVHTSKHRKTSHVTYQPGGSMLDMGGAQSAKRNQNLYTCSGL